MKTDKTRFTVSITPAHVRIIDNQTGDWKFHSAATASNSTAAHIARVIEYAYDEARRLNYRHSPEYKQHNEFFKDNARFPLV